VLDHVRLRQLERAAAEAPVQHHGQAALHELRPAQSAPAMACASASHPHALAPSGGEGRGARGARKGSATASWTIRSATCFQAARGRESDVDVAQLEQWRDQVAQLLATIDSALAAARAAATAASPDDDKQQGRRLTIGQAQGVVEKARGWAPSYNTIRNWAISYKIGEQTASGAWVIFEDKLLRMLRAD
jgi:hypothetical protein